MNVAPDAYGDVQDRGVNDSSRLRDVTPVNLAGSKEVACFRDRVRVSGVSRPFQA